MERQAQWRWWGERADDIRRPLASLAAVNPDEKFEAARPDSGVNLRLRCWWNTQPFGVPKHAVVELVRLELDGKTVQLELVRISPAGADRGDVCQVFHVAEDMPVDTSPSPQYGLSDLTR
jgi:hypothetical protein